MFARVNKLLQYTYAFVRREVNLRSLTNILIVIALVLGAITYLVLTKRFSFLNESRVQVAYTLFFLNITLLSFLALLIIARVASLYFRRRKGLGASRFHSRLAFIFSSFAIVPTIIAGLFASALYEQSIQAWFDNLTKGIILESSAISEIYSEEHIMKLRQNALAISYGLRKHMLEKKKTPQKLQQFLDQAQANRGLEEVAVFNAEMEPIATSKSSFAVTIEKFSDYVMANLKEGGIIGFPNSSGTRMRVMLRVLPDQEYYLLVGAKTNPIVMEHLQKSQRSKEEFKALEERRWGLRVAFIYIYGLVTLLLLLASVVAGLTLADYIAKPVEQLIVVAQRIRAGDWSTRVEIQRNIVEFLGLARAFNKMMTYINAQKRALEEANSQLEERRRFIETTLAGVSAGVIAFNQNNEIRVVNASAVKILEVKDESALLGQKIFKIFPKIKEAFLKSTSYPLEPININVDLNVNGITKYLHIRITAEIHHGEIIGQVLTLDDLTDLLTAQKKAAWGDVARRVAHEIKNPLTPIQLSAERLKRKFAKYVTEPKEAATFETCIDTITRKVDDIYRIVYEFSTFARLPQAVKKETNLVSLLHGAINQMRNAYPQISFELKAPEGYMALYCDEQLFSQAILNIIKNAIEALSLQENASFLPSVVVELQQLEKVYRVSFKDNGKGFQTVDPNKYLEPYITTKEQGSGLGLSIVKKIVEEHEGTISLSNVPKGGAMVTIELPKIIRGHDAI